MAKYRKKPVAVDAVRWFKPGDHPKVERWQAIPSRQMVRCPRCHGYQMDHGFLVDAYGSWKVCPGDWVVTEPGATTDIEGTPLDIHSVMKPELFNEHYVAEEWFDGKPNATQVACTKETDGVVAKPNPDWQMLQPEHKVLINGVD